MGLKNKLSKIKSFFIDEIDEEPEEVPSVKKVIKKEPKREYEQTKKYEPPKMDDMDDLFFEDVSDVDVSERIKTRSEKKEKEFPFAQFDDDDFVVAKEKPEPIIEQVKKEPRPVPLYQGSKRKEETKKFKPSPIISPIYGLLDEEGNTVKEENKENATNYNDETSLDEVRRKAYGKLEDELEDTIKRLSSKTIEEAEKEAEEKELSRSKNKEKIRKEEVKVISKIEENDEDDDDDDMILPNINFKEIDVDRETKKAKKKDIVKEIESNVEDDDDDDDTKEQDLFNLIDTMYQAEGDED